MNAVPPRDVHAEGMAALAAGAPTAAPSAAGPLNATGGAAAGVPWGDSPQQQLAALNADPNFMAALMDSGHPAHAASVARRSELFKQAYGDAPANGPGDGVIENDVALAGRREPTADEMTAAYTATATTIFERTFGAEIDHETAAGLAKIGIDCGLSTLDLSDIAQGIVEGGLYDEPQPGSTFALTPAQKARSRVTSEEIAAAAQMADHLNIPAEVLETEFRGLKLGWHPAVIKTLARKARTA